MGRNERLARNRAIAEKFYDGYHGSVERGFLNQAFDPDDFAEEWIFCSPYLGGESAQGLSTFLADGAAANHNIIWQKIPDYKMDDLRAWPTESGCAWRWRVNGHGLDGQLREFWEQLFVWTNNEGKITRFEFYDDWFGFAHTLIYAYGLTLDEFTKIDRYGSAPWNTGPPMTLHSPDLRPFSVPPANARVARNLKIAESFLQGYRRLADEGAADILDGIAFADGWVLFSPWTGEIAGDRGGDFGSSAAAEFRKIATRLPDVGVDQFEAWPTDDGCAWRWRLHGHSSEGTAYELWEQVFMLTDDGGQITRLEFFDDWQSFPQMMGFVTGLSIDELATFTRRNH
jgi:hypothetical protein